SAQALGWAGSVYEHVLGEDKYTFVEDVAQPASCTVLIKAPDDAAIAQIKDALRDGLRAVKNAHEDGAVVPGAGAWELHCSRRLREETAPKAQGKARLGVLAFADAMLAIPRVLAENAGLDAQECLLALQEEAARPGAVVGVDLDSGEPVDPRLAGVLDAYVVKKQCLQSAPDVATNLLLVDEVIRAGMNMRRK
ncbi:TCP-1/cpn60 chaperonin, partial [Helicosporidium sp. ATCC 50920]